MATTSEALPMAPATTSATGSISQYGMPQRTTSSENIEAPNAPISPWAKFTTRFDR